MREKFDNYSWLQRQNNFNEDNDYPQFIDEGNIVAASWFNDIKANHKEFEVRKKHFNEYYGLGQDYLLQ